MTVSDIWITKDFQSFFLTKFLLELFILIVFCSHCLFISYTYGLCLLSTFWNLYETFEKLTVLYWGFSKAFSYSLCFLLLYDQCCKSFIQYNLRSSTVHKSCSGLSACWSVYIYLVETLECRFFKFGIIWMVLSFYDLLKKGFVLRS